MSLTAMKPAKSRRRLSANAVIGGTIVAIVLAAAGLCVLGALRGGGRGGLPRAGRVRRCMRQHLDATAGSVSRNGDPCAGDDGKRHRLAIDQAGEYLGDALGVPRRKREMRNHCVVVFF